MSKIKMIKVSKVAASFLALVMLFSMLPSSFTTVFAATEEHPDTVTITVLNEKGEAISDAKVDFIIDSVENGKEYIKGSEKTDDKGTVSVVKKDQFAENDLTLSATISKKDFADVQIENKVIESVEQDFQVKMKSTVIDDVTVEPNSFAYDGKEYDAALVTGIKKGDAVSYKMNGETYESLPKIKEVGDYEVEVTVNRDGFDEFTKTVTSVVSKGTIELTVEQYSAVFNEKENDALTVKGLKEGDLVSYSLNGGEATSSIPKVYGVGKYEVKMHVERENYNDYDETFSDVEVTAATIEGVTATAYTGEYDRAEHEAVTVKGTRENDTVEYSIDDGEWSEAVPMISEYKEGGYKVNVKVTRENYDTADVEVLPAVAFISKADQTIKFSNDEYNSDSSNIEFEGEVPFENEKLDFKAIDEQQLAEGVITYSIVINDEYADIDDEKMAEIDENTGELKIYYPGTVTIVATLSGDNNYNEAEVKHTLNVAAKATSSGQYISFEKAIVNYTLGTNDIVSEQAVKKSSKRIKNDSITYSMEEIPGLSLNKNTGKLEVKSYNDVAEQIRKSNGYLNITITANLKKTKLFSADKAEYSVVLSFEKTPESPYTISGEEGEIDGEKTGWYIGAVTIHPKDDENGNYQISKTAEDFSESVVFDDQGTDTRFVCLRNKKTHGITDIIQVNVKIDTVSPSELKISYSDNKAVKTITEVLTLGFYQFDGVTITFEAKDETSQLNKVKWYYTKQENQSEKDVADSSGEISFVDGKATLTLPEETAKQYRGNIKFYAYDIAGNVSELIDENYVFVVDTISPQVEIGFSEPSPSTNPGTTFYYGNDKNGVFSAMITVEEANFFAENVIVKISKDGSEPQIVENIEWTDETVDKHNGKFTVSGDGDYKIFVEYYDYSGNQMILKPSSEPSNYESNLLVIDTIAPKIDFKYDKEKQSTIISITERNFRPEDISVNATVKNIKSEAIEKDDVISNELTTLLQNASWRQDSSDKNKYSFEYDEYFNGIYNYTIHYTDVATNKADDVNTDDFIIDHGVPTEPEITYSEPLQETVLSAITFGFYNPSVNVTFTSYDDISGVDTFTWSYLRQNGASEINVPEYFEESIKANQDENDKSKFTATIKLPKDKAEQLKGSISAFATDTYKNKCNKVTDDKNVIVVDTISPTRTVEYSPESRMVGTTRYYGNDKKGQAVVTFKINEANFFAEDVKVSISKNGGEKKSIAPSWTDLSVDNHVGTYTISGDGHYVVYMDYTDRSSNKMETYQSNMITIDTINPVIDVVYHNKNKTETLTDRENHKREYYDTTQKATITITEHNFNSDEVDFKQIIGKDITGKILNIDNLSSKSSWSNKGDVHSITITFSGDANYTLDVDYTDLANNKAEDYKPDYFTVDTKAPTVTGVRYSNSILDTVIGNVSFGFYNARMEVTVTATDDTSGVHGFNYSYRNASGVSSVNAELINQAIDEGSITYSADGRTATLVFNIPRDALGSNNQFNGTVDFTSTDRSHNETKQQEERRVVVDNISPTRNVTYNSPVNEVGGVSYYDGNINGTITINEANFDSQDVSVTYSMNGSDAGTLPVSWSDNSVDEHIGTFTLTSDGDYIVRISYTDKSSNAMEVYTSNQMTIDTKIEKPTYTINGTPKTENGGAYKEEANIGFSYSDQNFSTRKITLTRTRFKNKDVDVTEQFVKENQNDKGGSGSFDIPKKVENDGIYTLTVSMTDKANHSTTSHVKFTINRYGSVYEYSDYLMSLIKDGGQYITIEEGKESAITDDLVITEYNADKIVKDSLNILITRDGEPVNALYKSNPEISDNVEIGSSGWYQYTYSIDKSNFAEDGVYKISLSSKDATKNESISVPDNSIDANGKSVLDTMQFTVDTTAPEISNIANLDQEIIDAQEINVKYSLVDIGGLSSVEVYVDDETVDSINDFSKNRNDYSGEFTIKEKNEAQTVRIKVTDLAGNVTDTKSESFSPGEKYVFFDTVTVSTNFFVRWFANKPLFFGSIGGAVLILGGVGTIIGLKVRKKKKA